uniref:Mitochondrial inner membrane protein 1 n=1 Tax=Ganoderma boninense TaxID=34458 RepID=A0A5K1K7E5_9APHY|nr:Putative mitochondrial inner membrane protein 1 [Ganoderma boninense]
MTATLDCCAKLPADLETWRGLSGTGSEHAEAIWRILGPFFADRGYTLWPHGHISMTTASVDDVSANGYMYAASRCRDSDKSWDSLQPILSYESRNALTRAARASDGRDVVLKLLAIGDEGKGHLEILDMLARGPYSLITANHTLPLLDLIVLDDITFGAFPKVGYSCSEVYGSWAKSSVRDVLEMIAQCLEVRTPLSFSYITTGLPMEHQDVFKDNFVIQWLPETLRVEHDVVASRPRVYMIGFELAVRFPRNSPQEERVCVGPPPLLDRHPGGSNRPAAPETLPDQPYDPFKVDVWQLGTTFSDFKSTMPAIDKVLASMTEPDPATRPTAYEAMKALLDAVGAVPPVSLLIEPHIEPRQLEPDSTTR